jgi:hypothetical protein
LTCTSRLRLSVCTSPSDAKINVLFRVQTTSTMPRLRPECSANRGRKHVGTRAHPKPRITASIHRRPQTTPECVLNPSSVKNVKAVSTRLVTSVDNIRMASLSSPSPLHNLSARACSSPHAADVSVLMVVFWRCLGLTRLYILKYVLINT